MNADWLLRNARLAESGPLVDLALQDGVIAGLGPALGVSAAQTWDLAGRVVLPGLTDLHTHLDKTFVGAPNASGTLLEAIASYRSARLAHDAASVTARMERALTLAVQHGATRMRTHVNCLDDHDLALFEAILAVRERWESRIDLEIVALGEPTHSDERLAAMTRAIELADDIMVGGAPALMPDPAAAVDVSLDLAACYGRPIDLHIDETEDPGMRMLGYLAERVVKRRFAGPVTAGHCVSLAFMPDAEAHAVIAAVARAQIQVITLPSCNLVLMGRGPHPAPRGVTRVKALLAAGVDVRAGSDNVADPFNPFGAYDPLQAAHLNAHTAQ